MDLFSLGSSFFGGEGGRGLNPFTVFKQFDRDGNGKITEDDFVAAIATLGLGSVGEYAIRAIFKQIDSNHNGKLEISEALSGFDKIKSLIQPG